MWALLSILSCDESNRFMTLNFAQRLDPRNSLAARIGWVFAVLSIASALLIGWASSNIARKAVELDIGRLYADRAEHYSELINFRIRASQKALQTAANVLGDDNLVYQGQMQSVIAAVHSSLEDETWVGITDIAGHFRAGDLNEGDTLQVSDQEWLKNALRGPYISLGKSNLEIIRAAGPNMEASFGTVTISVPVKSKTGKVFALAVATFEISSFNDVSQMVGYTRLNLQQPDLYIYNREGGLLFSTAQIDRSLVARLSPVITSAIEQARGSRFKGAQITDSFLEGYATQFETTGGATNGLIAVVRQPIALAYQSANDTAKYIALLILAAGLILSFGAAFAVSASTKGLSDIANSATAMQTGASQEFVAIEGTDEAAKISKSLAGLFSQLKQSNSKLESLNRNLDQKVNERTREVQRLSEEVHCAAVTRERLRMSRDLHDTLAHSMLAMLAQIRLMKKIQKTKPELLEHELQLAELAAKDGLNEARNAVIGLRYFAVRDDGLGPALAKLLTQLSERVEIKTHLEISENAAILAGKNAETLYRIVEEALHNVEKHAKAQNVSVKILLSAEGEANSELSLVVSDDGIGFDPQLHKADHFGLVGMREQAELLSAEIHIESAPNLGTQIKLKLFI